MNLTNREKVLLCVATVLAVVYGTINFGINPLYEQYQLKTDQNHELVVKKAELDLKLINEQIIRYNHSAAEKRYLEIKEEYPEIMQNYAIDRLLTGLCLQNSLTPVSLGMSTAIPLSDYLGLDTSGNEEYKDALYVVTATMNLQGSFDALKRLVETVDARDYIRITQVPYFYFESADDPTTSIMSVFFEITMRGDQW